MRNLASAFFFFLFGLNLVFPVGNIDKNKTKSSDEKNKHGDTTKIIFIPKKATLDLLDYPAQSLYSVWDTTVIHPYYSDSYFEEDTIVLSLEQNGDCFTMPWKGLVTSGFGWRHGRAHTGTDIDLETGDTIVAAFSGKVRVARVAGGYGNCVIIRHPNGLETLYGHLSKILVKTGDEICSGDILGLGGNTGHSFGSHLHLEFRYLGKSINTERFINYKSWSLKESEVKISKRDFVMNKPSYSLSSSKFYGKKKHKKYRKNFHNHVSKKMKSGKSLVHKKNVKAVASRAKKTSTKKRNSQIAKAKSKKHTKRG